jgi:hypothetical protein
MGTGWRVNRKLDFSRVMFLSVVKKGAFVDVSSAGRKPAQRYHSDNYRIDTIIEQDINVVQTPSFPNSGVDREKGIQSGGKSLQGQTVDQPDRST